MRQRGHKKSRWLYIFFCGKENENLQLGKVFLYTITCFSLLIICFSLLFSNYSTYVFSILFMFIFVSCFLSNFVYSVFLYCLCIVLCIVSLLCCLFLIFLQDYPPLSAGGNPVAVNKCHLHHQNSISN